MKLNHLDEAACRAAIAAGDFPGDVAGAAPRVAVILTQSWCPQWAWMRSYLEALPEDPAAAVYWVEYDLEPFFEDFMVFKEGVYGNDQIPYVRYYRDGRPARESNFIDKAGFLRLLSA